MHLLCKRGRSLGSGAMTSHAALNPACRCQHNVQDLTNVYVYILSLLQPCKALACGACNTIEDEAIGCCTPQGIKDAWIKEYQAKVAKAMIQKGGSKAGMMSLAKAKEWITKSPEDKRKEEVCCAARLCQCCLITVLWPRLCARGRWRSTPCSPHGWLRDVPTDDM